jgi:hypothetical protein
MERFVDSNSYVTYLTEDGESIRGHQLAALAAGYEGAEVFEKVVHHMLDGVDVPGNVYPVSRSNHRQLHAGGPPDTRIASVLDQD